MPRDLATYRDDLGAALARIDALEPKPMAILPEKGDLFQRVRESFVSQPERWRRERIGWSYTDARGFGGWADRDGWVLDSPEQGEQQSIGFYRTGFFWIRIGEVRRRSADRLERINKDVWVYIFCPRFRRTIRKYRNWRLLKDLEKK